MSACNKIRRCWEIADLVIAKCSANWCTGCSLSASRSSSSRLVGSAIALKTDALEGPTRPPAGEPTNRARTKSHLRLEKHQYGIGSTRVLLIRTDGIPKDGPSSSLTPTHYVSRPQNQLPACRLQLNERLPVLSSFRGPTLIHPTRSGIGVINVAPGSSPPLDSIWLLTLHLLYLCLFPPTDPI